MEKLPPIIARIDLELGIIRIEDMKSAEATETIIAVSDYISDGKSDRETIEIILRKLKADNPHQDIFHTDF